MEIYARWECPYCGHSNIFVVTSESRNGLSVRHCFLDNGGCDRPVVIDVLAVEVTLQVRRIEGEKADEQPERLHTLAAVAEAEDNHLPTYSAEDTDPDEGIVF